MRLAVKYRKYFFKFNCHSVNHVLPRDKIQYTIYYTNSGSVQPAGQRLIIDILGTH